MDTPGIFSAVLALLLSGCSTPTAAPVVAPVVVAPQIHGTAPQPQPTAAPQPQQVNVTQKQDVTVNVTKP